MQIKSTWRISPQTFLSTGSSKGISSDQHILSGGEQMNPTIKMVLTWALILVIAVGLWNFVEHGRSIPEISLTDFLAKVDNGDVAEVKVEGSNVTGTLRQNGGAFRSTLPVAYHVIYEQLIDAKVKVTVVPVASSSRFTFFMSWVSPLLLAFGLGWQCARWSQNRRRQPPMTTV
jgi:ATP-dependent Zn protease